jgi:hypothetical protein
MIWRLFRPRPIVKVLLPVPASITDKEHKMILTDLEERVGKEYIVMLIASPESSEIKIEIVK